MTESKTLCFNQKRYFHRFKRSELSPSIDLLAWLHTQSAFPKMYWEGRDGVEMACAGSVLTLSKAPQFDSDNDSPARFFGGHAFFADQAPKDAIWDSFPRSVFFLPKYLVIRENGKLTGTINAVNAPITEEFPDMPSYFETTQIEMKEPSHFPCVDRWTELIHRSLSEIENEVFQKVVLARRSTHKMNVDFNPLEGLSRLRAPGGIRFAIQMAEGATFIGATPERLYKRTGKNIFTEAVAGTRKRGTTEGEDLLLQQELLESPKERREFAFVKMSIEEHLRPLCISLQCEEEDTIIKTPNVQHLHNPFAGVIRDGVGDGDLLAALHPTAAMGGLPKLSALEHLLAHEPFERGWYASPIGYLSPELAEFAVGIRSALVQREEVHLFAGTGIVEGSTPEMEWEELHHKTALWSRL